MTDVIAFERVAKSLPADVLGRRPVLLRDVTFAVEAGSCHGFVGGNGAGKSTSIRIAVGAVTPSAGRVTLLGHPPRQRSARQSLGFAPDIAAFDMSLTAKETIRLHWRLMGERGTPSLASLTAVELDGRANEPVAGFSKGMLQRLSLAVAMLGSPTLLILDEPMSGLDPAGRDVVRRLIRQKHQEGATVFFSSHVLSDVEELCSRITVIDKGSTRFSGPIDALIGDATGHRVTFGVDANTRVEAAQGFGLVLHGQRAVAEVASDEALAALLTAGLADGFRVITVETLRPNLEERVLELVSRSVS
jgi:ABC-2 type transport system ATP-binding protein